MLHVGYISMVFTDFYIKVFLQCFKECPIISLKKLHTLFDSANQQMFRIKQFVLHAPYITTVDEINPFNTKVRIWFINALDDFSRPFS